MPVLSNSRAVARQITRQITRLVASLGLVAVCASANVARSAAPQQFAALAPANSILSSEPAPAPRGPFGLTISGSNPFTARWQNLQPMLRIETQIVALCRLNPDGCPAAATKFIGIIDAARTLNGRARVGEINRAVNLAIRPVSDIVQYGVTELWASPLTTFASGAGDCEDYAIAKYVALREAGIAADDLRLVVVHDGQSGDDHAVVTARVDGDWLVLDNRYLRLLTDVETVSMTALFALGSEPDAQAPAAAVAMPDTLSVLDEFSV